MLSVVLISSQAHQDRSVNIRSYTRWGALDATTALAALPC